MDTPVVQLFGFSCVCLSALISRQGWFAFGVMVAYISYTQDEAWIFVLYHT